MKIRDNLAATIQTIMKERGLSLEEASEELCISRTALQSYVKAHSNPRADTLELLAEKLGVSVAELVSGMPETELPGREKIHPLFEPFIEDMLRMSDILYACGVPTEAKGRHRHG